MGQGKARLNLTSVSVKISQAKNCENSKFNLSTESFYTAIVCKKSRRSSQIEAGDQDGDHQGMTEINRNQPVSLVRGPVDLVDPVESGESVDLVEPYRLYSNLVLTVCLGIQVEWLPSLSPFIGYKQVSLFLLSMCSLTDRGRPAVETLCRR